MASARQLPLRVDLAEACTFDNFIAADNAELVAHLQRLVDGRGERVLVLWGDHGVGKTHLLQASCARAVAADQPIAFVPLAEHATLDPLVLQDLADAFLVCLDDVHTVIGDGAWARGLFDFYNRADAARTRLVISARMPPAALPNTLVDLVSRLAAGVCFRVGRTTDSERQRALQLRAKERGFELPDEVAAYILQRAPRDMHSLFELLHRLGTDSLAEQRLITIPFVKRLLD